MKLMQLAGNIKLLAKNPRFKLLFGLMKVHWPRFVVTVICMVIVAVTTSITAYLLKPILDIATTGMDNVETKKMLVAIPAFVVVLYLIRSVAMYLQQYFLSYVGQDLARKMRNMMFDKLMFVPISYFHREKTGVLMSRVQNDVGGVLNMMMALTIGPIKDIVTAAGLVFVIFFQIWELALLAMVIMPIAYFPIVYIGRRVRKLSKKGLVVGGELNASLQESFVGIKIVKAFGREEYEMNKFHSFNDYIFKLGRKSVKATALGPSVNEALAGIAIAAVIAVGGYYIMQGTYTIGTFASFLAAVLLLYEPLKRLSRLNTTVQAGMASMERVFEVLDYESDIVEKENPVILERKDRTVKYDNVSFGYDRGVVLKNINLNVKPGEVVALVGTSGGGKTSMLNLLPRFFDVTGGGIYMDGVDIRDVSIASLREQYAVVTQEPILFNDTIYNNILYGDLNATEEQVMAAAKAAYAYDFVLGFPQGFETNIGEMGGQISGGQKQRLCIARALLKNAPILILDEATSALDTESERLVQAALENLMRGRTTFMIAHRLSTINHADRILVVVSGQIVEEGNHDALMALEGEYYNLYQKQFKLDNHIINE